MWKIIKLDKNLANQISAWEVVERPVSVVKELVENSIDAGATSIKVEVKNGWIDEIIITDNWEWIKYEDLPIVFDKYTTSKIKSIQDLYNIMTFGFRWEALSSISSVSKVELITKTKDSLVAYSIKSIWWELSEIQEVAWENGTKIIVKELFYNTPARLNYLKKPRTEYLKILEFLQQISLSYPKIAFELVNDWKQVFQFREKQDLKTRIYNIFWDDFASNLLEINFEITGLKITGYISDPKISFTNKNKQVLFVNKRIIKSPLISKAISQAYNRYIPHTNNPWYVLNLEVDPTEIDVNVHPRKLEIRFAAENQVFRAFYHAIQSKLDSVSLIPLSPALSPQGRKGVEQLENQNNSFSLGGKDAWKADRGQQYYTGSGTKFKSYSPYKDVTINPAQQMIDQSINFSKEVLGDNIQDTKESCYNDFWNIFEKSTDLHDTALWKIIWQMHNSYILVETNAWLQILDQHALAERIIYEKLVKNSWKIITQWLLIWESLNLTPKELSILENNKEVFESMWFEFEIMWAWNVIINAIPEFIKKENIKNIFTWVIDDIWEENFWKSNTLQEVKNKIFAYTACRSAIKFWDKLSLLEMNKLLNDSVLDYSATCPHGRPVVYDISLDELKNKYER